MESSLRLPENFNNFHECIMSNFNYEIDDYVVTFIKEKPLYAEYGADNFCGYVWWQDSKWNCEIWIHKKYIKTITADTLSEIMTEACSEYGDD